MQVFPRMRNWTETNKQTGVGNALKRHYQNYLWEYEQAHPEDVTMDRCVLCNGERDGRLTRVYRYGRPHPGWPSLHPSGTPRPLLVVLSLAVATSTVACWGSEHVLATW